MNRIGKILVGITTLKSLCRHALKPGYTTQNLQHSWQEAAHPNIGGIDILLNFPSVDKAYIVCN